MYILHKKLNKLTINLLASSLLLISCGKSPGTNNSTIGNDASDKVTSITEALESKYGLTLATASANSNSKGIGIITNSDPNELVGKMNAGWNLGNYFDVPFKDKSTWGNPEPTRQLIKKVKETGFNTIRIPVTWRTHQQDSAPYQIELAYLERVKKVVDYAMENEMFVLLDTHHDTEVFQPIVSKEKETSERLRNTWLQIAAFFKDYNENLIFEILNEPRVKGNNEEWVAGNANTIKVLNNLHKVGVDAIRSTGGNNLKRQLMISTWAGKTNNTAMDAAIIPNNDPNIIITVHAYTPFEVCHDAKRPWNGQNDLNELTADLDNIKRKWITENNRPVILGEWAMLNNNPETGKSTTKKQRADYSKIYVKEASSRGMVPVLWDDGGWYRALNRNTLEWDSQEQADAIIENSKK